MTATFEMWRCAGCGKWSHAQTRPSAHQRSEVDEDESTAYVVWCGPCEEVTDGLGLFGEADG